MINMPLCNLVNCSLSINPTIYLAYLSKILLTYYQQHLVEISMSPRPVQVGSKSKYNIHTINNIYHIQDTVAKNHTASRSLLYDSYKRNIKY